MHPTERLSDEHRIIMRALDVLERVAVRLAEAPDEVAADARAIVDFIQGFADELHHGKEEHMLFPAMEEVGHSPHAGPIGVMLMEHDEGRGLVRQLQRALDTDDSAAFGASARAFAQLLSAHIMKEDQILFPMAERTLPQSLRASLVERFARHDEVEHGDAYRRYVVTLEALEKTYPD